MPESDPELHDKINHIIYSNLDQIKIPPKLNKEDALTLKKQILAVLEIIEQTMNVYIAQYADLYKKQAAQMELLLNQQLEYCALLDLVVDYPKVTKNIHTDPSASENQSQIIPSKSKAIEENS